jgi:exosome complex component RRP42
LEIQGIYNAFQHQIYKFNSTDVLVGVKLEIGEPSLSTPDRGAIHFSVEWYYSNFYCLITIFSSTSASPEFEGKGGESLESELSAMLSRTILLELTQLCIIPGL